MNFAQWLLETFAMDETALTPEQRAKFEAIYNAEQQAGEGADMSASADMDEDEQAKTAAAGMAAARGRVGSDGASTDGSVEMRAAQAAIQATRMEAARVNRIRAMANGNDALANQAIEQGWPADRFELAQLRAGRGQQSAVSSSNADDELEPQVMAAALLLNSSMQAGRLKNYYSEEVLNRASGREYRGFSLVECAEQIMRRSGVAYKGNRKQTGHMEAARDASARMRAAGFSSFTLSSILENVADKVLLDAYQSVNTIWQTFCSVRSLNDFKVHSQYALDPTNTFKKVGPQGDFDQLKFSDRKYSLQAESYGVRCKIDYQTWRNDDLGSINDRLAKVSILGASTIEQIVFALVMAGINNTSLFHTNNANYLANSANYALGLTGFEYAEKTIGNQVTAANTPLGIELTTLLVGTVLKPRADQYYTSARLNETTTADKGKGQDNPFVQKYKPIKAPYLNNTLLKDNEGTTISHQDDGLWMLFGTQGNSAAMHVGFLDGQQSPNVEIINNQSEMVGFEIAAGLHFGVGYGDPKLGYCANPNNA